MEEHVRFIASTTPTLLFLGLYVVFIVCLLKIAFEILYASALAGIQKFPWARQRWGKRGFRTLVALWILLPPVMIVICLVIGVVFGTIFLLRSKNTARELDALFLQSRRHKALSE